MPTPSFDVIAKARDDLAHLRAQYGRDHRAGCSLVAHRDLGFCSSCALDRFAEVRGWRLLAMIDRGMVPQ